MKEELCVQTAPLSARRAMYRPRCAQICAARCLLHLVDLRRDAPRPRHVAHQMIFRPAGHPPPPSHEAATAANRPAQARVVGLTTSLRPVSLTTRDRKQSVRAAQAHRLASAAGWRKSGQCASRPGLDPICPDFAPGARPWLEGRSRRSLARRWGYNVLRSGEEYARRWIGRHRCRRARTS